MTLYLVVIFAAFLGGVVQATTGFGSGIIMLLFFPAFLPVVQSAALSNMISIILLLTMAWRYRKFAKWDKIWFPMTVYTIVAVGILLLLPGMDASGLKLYFSFFLVALGIYFIFFAKNFQLKANVPTAIVCSVISGAASGFFGIGGPLMAVYFLGVLGDDKDGYIGTTQVFFFITSFINNMVRVANGIMTADLVLPMCAGIVGMTLGSLIGGRILNKLNAERFKKVIYGFILAAGCISAVDCLL